MEMPYDYTDPYRLPSDAAKVMPQGLATDFFSSLDKTFQNQEAKQREDLLNFQESRGLLKSGQTNKKLIEDVLGPGEERRRAAFLPYAFQAAATGQGQEFQRSEEATGFDRQRQFAGEQFQRQLQYLQEQASLQQELVRLQAQLEASNQPGFMSQLGSGFASGFGQGAGKGAAAGAFNLMS